MTQFVPSFEGVCLFIVCLWVWDLLYVSYSDVCACVETSSQGSVAQGLCFVYMLQYLCI